MCYSIVPPVSSSKSVVMTAVGDTQVTSAYSPSASCCCHIYPLLTLIMKMRFQRTLLPLLWMWMRDPSLTAFVQFVVLPPRCCKVIIVVLFTLHILLSCNLDSCSLCGFHTTYLTSEMGSHTTRVVHQDQSQMSVSVLYILLGKQILEVMVDAVIKQR